MESVTRNFDQQSPHVMMTAFGQVPRNAIPNATRATDEPADAFGVSCRDTIGTSSYLDQRIVISIEGPVSASVGQPCAAV